MSDSPWDVYTSKAEIYAQHRLNYVPEAIAETARLCGLQRDHHVADIGAGTGLLTRHFLDLVGQVTAVEPNDAMRYEAEKRLGGHPSYRSVAARAEQTTLLDHSVHLIAVGQALHWFQPEATLSEFQRILADNGYMAIFSYRLDSQIWQKLAEHLQQLPESFRRAKTVSKGDPADYLAPGFQELQFPASCRETWEQFWGGALSAASAPVPGDPGFEAYREVQRRAFDELSEDGFLVTNYFCLVSLGRLKTEAEFVGKGEGRKETAL